MTPSIQTTAPFLAVLAGLVSACVGSRPAQAIEAQVPIDSIARSVDQGAAPGWAASLVHESDSGIWNTGTLDAFPQYGSPEVFALDDKGRCTLLVGYSGNYSANVPLQEREWLGDLESLQLERPDGDPEFYTGGKRGNLYQVRCHPDASFDTRLIARFPAEEIHILAGGELDPTREGRELLVFTHPGHVYLVRQDLAAQRIASVGGRVRQTVALPVAPGAPARLAAATRAGAVLLLGLTGDTLQVTPITEEPCGFGRIALAPVSRPGTSVLYATRDDGLVLRFEERADGWRREPIYAGPQGPRGLAAGRFDSDAEVETVAVFGYSGRVELLSRHPDQPWRVETIFTDRDKGHWLETAELDGRNGTDELLCSGYGKRVILLARPPGHGLPGVPAEAPPASAARERADLRVGVIARPESLATLSPLSYRGGFETKTFIYETLVTRDAAGELAPGLASAWRAESQGRVWLFTPRPGARWHDGEPVTAEDLRVHVERWAGLPESRWFDGGRLVHAVTATDSGELRVELSAPHFLPAELCAINPTAVLGPGAFDDEGRFVAPLGSGPYRLRQIELARRTAWLEPVEPGDPSLELRCFDSADARAPLASLLAGELDLVADGWYRSVPREEVEPLAADARFELLREPGSIVRYLAFAPASQHGLELRRAVAAAIDRQALVDEVERGFATPCASLFAPALAAWPPAPRVTAAAVPAGTRLRLVGALRDAALCRALARQLEPAGFALDVRILEGAELEQALRSGSFDLRLAESYGVPYDPELTLATKLRSPRAASEEVALLEDATLDGLIDALGAALDAPARRELYARIAARVADQAELVPLYVPERLALLRRGHPAPRLDLDVYRLVLGQPRS